MAKQILRMTMLAAVTACAWSFAAHAGVSPEEAAKLKTELTPFGAERAGNKDGTIPAWTGGMVGAVPGDVPGKRRVDPFKDEKPLLRITAKNMDQYADKLSAGTIALFKKFPDTYRLDVYPTHRTAAAPQSVYDNTFKNATRGKLNGGTPEGVAGGIPFPIPKTGGEVIWNHLLRWRAPLSTFHGKQWAVTADGRMIMVSDSIGDTELPYYFADATPEGVQANHFWSSRLINSGPPLRAGEGIVGHETLDPDKTQTWVYLTGQRRVRKLPNACCDTPAPAASGIMFFDELFLFNGRMDRFDWKLVGKKEMYIPYNSNRTMQTSKDSDVVGKNHLNPDYVRWEQHRVWVIDAEVKAGLRHVAKHSRYYCDEDTWWCLLAERYDGNNQLWRATFQIPYLVPEVPTQFEGPFGLYDLVAGGYFVGGMVNEVSDPYIVRQSFPTNHFTPESLAGEGVR